MGPPPQPIQDLLHTVECISVTDVYGLQRLGASLNGSDSSSNHTRNKTPTHRWLKSTDAFAARIEKIWRKSVETKKQPPESAGGNDTSSSANTSATLSSGLRPDQVPENFIVALIDDGVDTMTEHLTGRILPGRTFGFEGDRNLPWYASESGHGTVIASMIARICPMAKIYPIRLNTGAKLKAGVGAMINVASAAHAIRAAVNRGAKIISMSWSINRPSDELGEIFEKALEYALKKNVLMFCSSRDSGHDGSITYYPAAYRRDSVIKMGAAQPTGLPYEWAGQLANLDFILPGVEVVPPSTFRNVEAMGPETGSSVATALGAGLAALIIYCAKMNKMFGSGGNRISDNDINRLQKAEFMIQTIQKFGMSTSEGTKNKFVEVWKKLDDKTKKLVGATRSEEREIVAQLARDLISPSAS